MPDETATPTAEALYRAGDYQAAAALLRTALAADPNSSAATRILGLCHLRLGAVTEGVALLSQARSLAPQDPWAVLHHGVGLQAAGQHGDAIALFRRAHMMLPREAAPLLNLSASLRASGDVAGAITAARKGRLRGPAQAEACYVLGQAYAAGSFHRPAIQAFWQAAQLAPAFADAWVELGLAHYRSGNLMDAIWATRKALEAAPGHEAASSNLAIFSRLIGRQEEAEALLTEILERHPHSATARLNLAADHLREDRATEALAVLDGGPAAPETRQQWRLQRSLALIKLGRAEEAQAELAGLGPVPPALEPLLLWRRVLLAPDTAQADKHAAAMAAALAGPASIVPEHRIMGYYDLARYWWRRGEPDQAFPNWHAAHRLLAQSQPFSRKAFGAFVDAVIERFDAARFTGGPLASNRDGTPVFVVGMPRSGTTLVEQILAAHHAVHGAGEREDLADAFRSLGGDGVPDSPATASRVAALEQTGLDQAAAAYLRNLHALDPTAGRIVDKMPGNFRYLGLAGLMLPGARIIACERDPRDIGFSILTFRFYGAHPYAHDLGDLGWYIGQQKRLMAHWRAVLPNPILTVQLRDWVEDFDGTLRRVLAFLDLPYDPACERFHEVDRRVRTVSRHQVRQAVNARGLDRWQPYARHLAPLIEALQESGAL